MSVEYKVKTIAEVKKTGMELRGRAIKAYNRTMAYKAGSREYWDAVQEFRACQQAERDFVNIFG
jgi:hypothetical protein